MRTSSFINSLRGSIRLGKRPAAPPAGPSLPSSTDFALSVDEAEEARKPEQGTNWLGEARKLVPGETVAGYLTFKGLSTLARNPLNLSVVVALVFCFITIYLSWVGTQDVKAPDPAKTVEWEAVIVSTLAYVALVYSSGGQIWWHKPFDDQALYGQLALGALSIVAAALAQRASRKTALK